MSLDKIFTHRAESDIKKEIVLELLNTDKNLDEKTELDKPINWACLKSMHSYIKNLGLNYSAEIIENFITQTFKYLISKERKGRDEYIQSLRALANMQDEMQDNSQNSKLVGGL